MATFIFGGDTNETPDGIKRKRDIARALLSASAPRNVGEGISALGDGIVSAVLNSRADKAEKTGLASADTAWAKAMGGGSPQAATGAIPMTDAAGEASATSPGGGMNYRDAIASIESKGSGDYSAIGPRHSTMGRAMGRYQVMESNIGPWSQEALGRAVTPDEFMADPKLQDAIFDHRFGKYVDKFGPEGAAQAWFGGEGGVGKTNRKDVLGTSIGGYGQRFMGALGKGGGEVASASPETAFSAVMPENSTQKVATALAGNTPTTNGQQDINTQANAIPAEFQQSGQLRTAMDNRRGIVQALMSGTPASEDQLSQARATGAGTQGQTGQGPLGLDPSILEALSNPFLSDGRKAVLKTMIDQQMGQQQAEREMRMKQADPAYQLGLEKSRLELDALRNPKADPLKIGQGETVLDPATGRVIYKADPKPEAKPSAVQEYEYAKEQGFPGTFQDWEASKKGGMSLQVDPATGAVTFQQGGNIKPMTEGQSKDAVFSTRAEGALPLIDSFGDSLTGMEGAVGNTVGQLPVVGNFAKSEGYQKAEQAGKEFLQAILRKDTGAAITADETSEYGTVYLPRPGDSPALLAQKKASRLRALEAIKAGMPPQAILAQEKALANTAAATGEVKIPDGMDPADWEFMTPDERRLFAQ